MKKKILCIVIFFVLSLSGCGNSSARRNDMKNVEERDYATVFMVRPAKNEEYQFVLGIAKARTVGEKSEVEEISTWTCKDIDTLSEEYSQVKGKDLSLAHLKIILYSFDKEATMEFANMITLLDDNSEVAKTCPMFSLDEWEKFKEYATKSETPVGAYLEDLIRTQERAGENIPWIKDYKKELNGDGKVDPYHLVKVGEGFEIMRMSPFF